MDDVGAGQRRRIVGQCLDRAFDDAQPFAQVGFGGGVARIGASLGADIDAGAVGFGEAPQNLDQQARRSGAEVDKVARPQSQDRFFCMRIEGLLAHSLRGARHQAAVALVYFLRLTRVDREPSCIRDERLAGVQPPRQVAHIMNCPGQCGRAVVSAGSLAGSHALQQPGADQRFEVLRD